MGTADVECMGQAAAACYMVTDDDVEGMGQLVGLDQDNVEYFKNHYPALATVRAYLSHTPAQTLSCPQTFLHSSLRTATVA